MTDKEKKHSHDAECGCAGDADSDFITLEFDDGESVECEVMGVFEYEGKEYIALIPGDDTDDVYIYGYKEIDDEEFELIDIDDDEEFQKVVAEFEKMTVEEEDEE